MNADKKICAELIGGLGNQLFQISNAYILSQRFKTKFVINFDRFFCGQGNHPSKYFSTLYLNIKPYIGELSTHSIAYAEKGFAYYNHNTDILALLEGNNEIHMKGYWQSEHYFSNKKNELRELFNMKFPFLHIPKHVFLDNPAIHDITNTSCLICVRRGDYLKNPQIHNPCGMTYFNRAITHFPSSTKFFIISDDLKWCMENFKGDQFVFLDIKDDLVTLSVGALFNNYIISNSTFYWWMSYFSIYEAPTIVAPDKWINISHHQSIYRSEMIIIERPIEV